MNQVSVFNRKGGKTDYTQNRRCNFLEKTPIYFKQGIKEIVGRLHETMKPQMWTSQLII
jgi:hypothetical protein